MMRKSLPRVPAVKGMTRRSFVGSTIAAAASAWPARLATSADSPNVRPAVCAFIKFVQSSSYEELSERLAEAGFDGIEATVRQGGYIEPAAAVEELPKLVEALAKHGLGITVLCSDVRQPDQPHALTTLRTAAALGVKRYRLGSYKYDLQRPVLPQLDALRPVVKELAALNRELGMQGLIQNHSGANYVGAPIWDAHRLIHDIAVGELGMAFDIRHAAIEGGLSWPLQYNLMRPHIGAIYVKDFQWRGSKAVHVPLGAGRVDPKFFQMVRRSGCNGPYSLHVEYLEDEGAAQNFAALKTDLKRLRMWLNV